MKVLNWNALNKELYSGRKKWEATLKSTRPKTQSRGQGHGKAIGLLRVQQIGLDRIGAQQFRQRMGTQLRQGFKPPAITPQDEDDANQKDCGDEYSECTDDTLWDSLYEEIPVMGRHVFNPYCVGGLGLGRYGWDRDSFMRKLNKKLEDKAASDEAQVVSEVIAANPALKAIRDDPRYSAQVIRAETRLNEKGEEVQNFFLEAKF